MLENPSFWFSVSFIVFLCILWKYKVHKLVLSIIDARISHISNQLDHTRQLHEDAKSMLAAIERDIRSFEENGRSKLDEAAVNSKKSFEAAKLEIARDIDEMAEVASLHLDAERKVLVEDFKSKVSDISISAAELIVLKYLNKDGHNRLIDDAVNAMSIARNNKSDKHSMF